MFRKFSKASETGKRNFSLSRNVRVQEVGTKDEKFEMLKEVLIEIQTLKSTNRS